jgi:hypothetical protein
MIGNIIVALVVPWILILYLYHKDKKVLLTVGPFQSALAFCINGLGFHFGFWDLYPFGYKDIVHMPFDIGIYPMLSAWMIYFISKKKSNPFAIILAFSLFTTGIEGIGVLLGRVIYNRGWNIGWTFLSYAIPYLLNYRYYLSLSQLGIFDNSSD